MRIKPSLIAVLALAMLGGSALHADIIYTYTDTNDPWGLNGNAITYTLTLYDLTGGGNKGSALFQIVTGNSFNPGYYAVEFDFKLSGGDVAPELSNLTSPAGTGPWSELDNSNSQGIYKNGKEFKTLSAGAAGFAVTSILFDGTAPDAADYAQGILINGGADVFSFTFDFDLGMDSSGRAIGLHPEIIPLQAIFFEGDKFVGQLSEELVHSPEPGSLLLLGTGIAVLGLAAWRKRR